MNFFEIARRWTILLLAEVLGTTTGVIGAILPGRPRWLAQIRVLEAQLRAAAHGGQAQSNAKTGGPAGAPPALNAATLLAAYEMLHRALKDIEARGLALDDGLLTRMQDEWTAESVIGYLKSCDEQLRHTATAALDQSAKALGIGAAGGAGQRPANLDKAERVR